MERRDPAVVHFIGELVRGLIGIPATAFGVLLIAAFFQVAVEEASNWWQAILAFGLALLATGVAALIIGWAASTILAPAAAGWFGIFSGRRPKEFGPDQQNGARAAASLTLLAICLPLGIMLFRHGVSDDMANWAIMGLFLAGSGVIFGLGAAVPRLYFSRRSRSGPLDDVDGEGVIGFFIAALIGVGLSLSICFGLVKPSTGSRDAKLDRRYQICAVGTQEEVSEICPKVGKLTVAATPKGRRLLVEHNGRCTLRIYSGEVRQPLPRWVTLRRLGIKTYDKEKKIFRILLEAKPNKSYEIRVFSRSKTNPCFTRVTLRAFSPKGQSR